MNRRAIYSYTLKEFSEKMFPNEDFHIYHIDFDHRREVVQIFVAGAGLPKVDDGAEAQQLELPYDS